MDTIKDPGCSWIIHPDMTLGSSLGQDDILALGGTATQVGIVQSAVWLPDTTRASGCGPNPGPLVAQGLNISGNTEA